MRGPISTEEPDALGVAAPLRRVVPGVYQEDPLFALLCRAFDDLLAPLVTAVDCFEAYLDPQLAPADFLPWLADLVGYQGTIRAGGAGADGGDGAATARDLIASAVRDHGRRGTAAGVREAAARAAGVPVEQVELDDPGGTRWSAAPGGAAAGGPPPAAPRVRVQVRTPDREQARDGDARRADTSRPGTERTLAAVRAAIEAAAGVHCGIAVEVTAPPAQRHRTPPPGARTYGGEEP
jgi:phage tail-like protein